SIADAMEHVQAEAGKSFDPRVVGVLSRRYHELERGALVESSNNPGNLSAVSPDIGRLAARLMIDDGKDSIVDPIVAARKETELLRVLAVDAGRSLLCSEIAAAVHKCLAQIVNYDTLVLYVPNADQIQAVGVVGRSAHRFLREPVPCSGGL